MKHFAGVSLFTCSTGVVANRLPLACPVDSLSCCASICGASPSQSNVRILFLHEMDAAEFRTSVLTAAAVKRLTSSGAHVE